MVYVFKFACLMIGFLAIPQSFSSYELLLGEVNKENSCQNRKQQSPPMFKEQSAVPNDWEVSELQKLEKSFRQAFITQQRSYNLLEMIRALKALYKDEIAFKIEARNFKVQEPEHLQFLWHCCKEVKEREQVKA